MADDLNPKEVAKYLLRRDNDGKLQIYSARFNVLLAEFSRSVGENERRDFFAALTRPLPRQDGPQNGRGVGC